MKILGIETATALCGVALIEGESPLAQGTKFLAEYKLNIRNIHSEKLVSMVKRVLSDAHNTMVDGVAVSIGPGSFTGLRIGLSAAKGLSYANDKPLIAVPTLDAIAYRTGLLCQLDSSITICPMLDARRDEVYYAFYKWEASEGFGGAHHELKRLSDYCAGSVTEILPRLSRKTIVVGDAVEKLKRYTVDCILPENEFQFCSPIAVAQIGLKKLINNDVADIHTLEPFYLKDFVAKRAAVSVPDYQQ